MTQQVSSQQPNIAPSSRGCFGMAWDDVTSSPGYIKKAMLMALISIVPVLNFVNLGYCWNWARQVAFGQREHLPQTIVNGENFKMGFYAVVMSLVVGLVVSAESALIVWVFAYVGNSAGAVVLGTLVVVVLAVFALMFGTLATGRVAVFDALGQGFSVGKIMAGFQRKLGTLFCVTYVPALVGGLIYSAIDLVLSFVIGAVVGVNVLAMVQYAGASSANAANMVSALFLNNGAFLFVVGLIAIYVTLVITAFVDLVCLRGVGYYIARFVPEWGAEARAEIAAYSQVAGAYQNSQTPQSPQDMQASAYPAQPRFNPQTGEPLVPQAQNAPSAVAWPASSGAHAQAQASAPHSDGFDPADTSVLQRAPQHSPVRTDVPDYNYDTVVGLASAPAASSSPAWETSGKAAGRMQSSMADPDDAATSVLSVSPAPQKRAALRITRANGQACTLAHFPVTIGKGSEADLVIEGNPAISRVHVRLLNDGDTFAAEDLASTNKTKIGSYELPAHVPTILSDGDELKLANEVLRIEIC